MKVQNAVVGMEVQVKRDCRGHSDEFIKKGLVCTVGRIDDSYMAEHELRLKHPDIDGGFAWVNASDVRRYNKPTESLEPVIEPQEVLQVGDSVLVGAEGAGYGCVVEEYAGLTCSVVATSYHADCVKISHPSVMSGQGYTSLKKYLTKVTPKPKALTLQDIQVGDWVVCNGVDTNLTKGIAYEVVGVTSWGSLLVSNPSERNAKWVTGYAVRPRSFNKVLREVNDATPRVVKSGSESTCRSE